MPETEATPGPRRSSLHERRVDIEPKGKLSVSAKPLGLIQY
jgi:hypothetical protein